jgi:predicted  nucleic acid-binding Zn-ribbon protein
MVSEPIRRLHEALRAKLGPGAGDDLIEVLAPLERDELASHSDILRLESEIARLDGKIDKLEGKIEAQTGKLLAVLIPIIIGTWALAVGVLTFVR